MLDIDFIIPCYGKSEIIEPGLLSLAHQWHKEYIHITLVNDCSPNTDCNYQDLVDKFSPWLDIRVVKTDHNGGQGLARQKGIDSTSREYFMFMDEDDQIANGLAISMFIGALESTWMVPDEIVEGAIKVNPETGEPLRNPDAKPVALVSGPLFEFDDNHTHIIDNYNRVWVNSKLYNRKFIEKHNIRFNEAQSRHAEDYYWMSCFFFSTDHDDEYQSILMNNNDLLYLWYPNEGSQSRVDPHYGFMLSGYTMDGSLNILKWIKDTENNKLEWNDSCEQEYVAKVLNMTVYSFYTFLSFIRHVASTDYVPKLELDWTLLRDACNGLRLLLKENFDKYSYMQVLEELVNVKKFSDVQYSEPWIAFEDYVVNGMEEFDYDFNQLLTVKDTYSFDENGFFIEKKEI